jgi:hypothetical protein
MKKELAQRNAWDEKEKLSAALEAERQSNMNNIISAMMVSFCINIKKNLSLLMFICFA